MSSLRNPSDVIITSPQVDEVLLYSHQIDELIGSLETCEYRQPKFRELLDRLQKMIDDLNLRSYSNLSQWVSDLDRLVGGCGRGRGVREGERERGRGRGGEGEGEREGERERESMVVNHKVLVCNSFGTEW